MYLLLESFQRLSDTFSDLGQFASTKDNKHDHQNDDQLRDTHSPEHNRSLVRGLASAGHGLWHARSHSIGPLAALSRNAWPTGSQQRGEIALQRQAEHERVAVGEKDVQLASNPEFAGEINARLD